MKLRFLIFGLVSFTAFVAGCKSSTGPNSNPSIAVTRPGVGSTFLYHDQAFDSLGRSVLVYDRWDTIVIVSSGISYQGKSNVVSFKTTTYHKKDNSISTLVGYLNYESNGDISHYIAPDGYP